MSQDRFAPPTTAPSLAGLAQVGALGLTLVGALGLVACTPARGKLDQGAQAQRASVAPSDLIFSHALHAEQDVACESCHQGLERAATLAPRATHVPTKAACAECHDVKDQAACKTCHRDPAHPGKLARRAPTPRLRFSHQQHLARGTACVSCHGGVMVSASLDQLPRPAMRADCFACHNHLEDYRKLSCTNCHASLRDFPLRAISQFNHEGNFIEEHARPASAQPELCASCHRQPFCADCHSRRAAVLPELKHAERADREFIHRGDWISRHAIVGRGDIPSCTRCHSLKSCDRCHSERGVSATAGAAARAGRSPHAPDWMTPGSPNGHGLEARRHIVECASCHDQGPKSNCVRCHRASSQGGLGINPHPPGWEARGQRDKQMCRFCH